MTFKRLAVEVWLFLKKKLLKFILLVWANEYVVSACVLTIDWFINLGYTRNLFFVFMFFRFCCLFRFHNSVCMIVDLVCKRLKRRNILRYIWQNENLLFTSTKRFFSLSHFKSCGSIVTKKSKKQINFNDFASETLLIRIAKHWFAFALTIYFNFPFNENGRIVNRMCLCADRSE